MQKVASTNILSTILRHDAKVTSYKIALLRAINDVALTYPNLSQPGQAVLVPLRILAEFWIAYYWPSVEPGKPMWQGNPLPDSLRCDGVRCLIRCQPETPKAAFEDYPDDERFDMWGEREHLKCAERLDLSPCRLQIIYTPALVWPPFFREQL